MKSVVLRKSVFAAVTVFGLLAFARPAAAVTLSFQPSPSDMYDLDHHYAYVWRIDNIPASIPANNTVTGARLTITNIANWDNTANMLFIHLFNSALGAGVTYAQDVDPNQVPVVDIADAFGANNYNVNAANLIQNVGTSISATEMAALNGANTFLTQRSFTTTPTTYVYNFTQAQVLSLVSYIANNGDIAMALDSDCHFYNDGVLLQLFTSPTTISSVPEPATLSLLALGLGTLYVRRRRA